jgi:Secretion system C-terminal sorting domain/Ig-like domain CHU_C associated/Beta-propeller repeat
MKKYISILILGLSVFAINAYAQTPTLSWVKQVGGAETEFGYSIAVHSNGDVYTTGFFTDAVDFNLGGSGSSQILTADSTDIFICKHDSLGVLKWARRMGGPTSKDASYGIALDANGNAYITGFFKGTAKFENPGVGSGFIVGNSATYTLTSAGELDIFVAKFTSSGNLSWVRKMGGTKNDVGYAITVDKSNDIYITGWFSSKANLDPNGTNNFTAYSKTGDINNPTDIFITKIKTDGSTGWSKQMGGGDFDFGFSIKVDANKNVYTTGGFKDNTSASNPIITTSPHTDFDPGSGTITLSSAGDFDIFVSKLDSTGAIGANGWAKRMGGSAADFGTAITVDRSGNVLTTGWFEGTANFDPNGTKKLTASGSTSYFDNFISKLSSAGVYQWAKVFGGSADDWAVGIAVDSSDNVYTTGGFKNTVDFNNGASPAQSKTAQGKDLFDIYITKTTSSGNYVWTQQFGGVNNDVAAAIVVDTKGSIYVTGGFKKTVDFDPTTVTKNMVAVSDSTDAFILKLDQPAPCIVTTPTVTVSNICGSSTLTASTSTGTYLWSPGGQTTNAITVTSAGTYSVVITKNNCASNPGIATAAPIAVPAKPTVTVSDVCGSSTLTSSTTTGSYLWSYGNATTKAITVTSAGSYSVTVTENGCTSASASGTAAPKAVPATPSITVSNGCGSSTLTSSTTTGTYLWNTGGATTQAITVTTAATYSVTVTENGCASAAATKTSAPIAIPTAPGVSSPISYCQNSTTSTLTATGTNLAWYTAASGGSGSSTNPKPSSTTVGQQNYYVSQTVNSCESARALITVNITAGTSAPTVTSPVNYCKNSTPSPLTAIGDTLLWYTVSSGGTGTSTAYTPSTNTIGTVSYYVSQTQCGEGPRAQIDVITNAIPAAPTVTANNSCGSSTLTASGFTGTLLWSTSETSASIIVTNAASYSVAQTVNSCVSPNGTGTAAPKAIPAAPTVTSPILLCQNSTASPLTASGDSLLWYSAATGGTGSATATSPSTATVSTTNYFVSQTVNTCESPRASITVSITATPAAPVVVTPKGYCQNATPSDLTATGSNLLWYTVATSGTGSSTKKPSTATVGATDYFVSQTVNSCESNRAVITVNVSANTPAPTVTSPVNYCKNAVPNSLTAIGDSLLWYTAATGGTGSASASTPSTLTAGSTSYFVSQKLCGEGPRAQIVVTVNPIPTITVNSITVCSGKTATLTASGGTTYLWSDSETTESISFIPTAETSYTVTGTKTGCSTSVVAKVTMCSGVGITENTNSQNVFVYPNPSIGEFTISISNASSNSLTISVVDILGQEVYSESVKNNSSDFTKHLKLENLSNGIYYLHLTAGTDLIIKKLIIQ